MSEITVEQFNDLYNTLNILENSYNKYRAEIKKSNCDKYQACFNGDSRFASFDMKLQITSYLGYFGNSSCSKAIHIGQNPDIFKNALLKYLNRNFDKIITDIINQMKSDLIEAKSVKEDKLRKEIEKWDDIFSKLETTKESTDE